MNIKRLVVRLTVTIAISFGLTGLLTYGVQAADIGKVIESCADCHGKDGASKDSSVPIIGGFSAAYANDTMIAYKEEERACPESEYLTGDKKGKKITMCEIADDLDEDEIKEIAEYFAAKPFVRAKQEFNASLVKKGQELQDDLCVKCHDKGGSLASDDSGILAGQWIPYLRQSFKDYSAGDRPMTKKMKKKYEKLKDDDIEALIHYFASFQ